MGRKSKKGSSGGKGASESVRWERAAGWLRPGDNVQRTLGLRKLCPAKRASSPSSSSILQERKRDGVCQALAARGCRRHPGTGDAGHRQQADMGRGSAAPAPVGLHPRAQEEGRSLLQRSPRDPTVISAPSLRNVPPTNPIYPWAFNFSHRHSPVLSSAFPSLEPLTS